MNKRSRLFLWLGILLSICAVALGLYFTQPQTPDKFNGQRAYQDVVRQVNLGPRTAGSSAHAAVVKLIRAELEQAGWTVEIQETSKMGHLIQNIIAKRGGDSPPVILGAHYDSRMFADNDPDPTKQKEGTPGANDGASGVAVLLELARVLPKNSVPVWLVFFDAEDNGKIEGWDWILGSRTYAESLTFKPQAAVVIDMVGDKDLRIFQEGFSDKPITAAIWAQAKALGHENIFIPNVRYNILDDHVPFLDAGIPAVDIIDINYDYWHTTQDTADKVAPESLQIVGATLLAWLGTLTR